MGTSEPGPFFNGLDWARQDLVDVKFNIEFSEMTPSSLSVRWELNRSRLSGEKAGVGGSRSSQQSSSLHGNRKQSEIVKPRAKAWRASLTEYTETRDLDYGFSDLAELAGKYPGLSLSDFD